MNKELTKVYNTVSAWMDETKDPDLTDAFDSVLRIIEDIDEHYSCLNCKHWDDYIGCTDLAMDLNLTNLCSRCVEDKWEGDDE
jgi:hypothetical protein